MKSTIRNTFYMFVCLQECLLPLILQNLTVHEVPVANSPLFSTPLLKLLSTLVREHKYVPVRF